MRSCFIPVGPLHGLNTVSLYGSELLLWGFSGVVLKRRSVALVLLGTTGLNSVLERPCTRMSSTSREESTTHKLVIGSYTP